MSSTPLKLNGSAGDLKEMTTTEERWLAYMGGVLLGAGGTANVGAITRASSGNTSIGSYTNTRHPQAVGTHPGSSISTDTTTTTLYQTEGVQPETSSNFHRPVGWDTSPAGIQEMPDTEFNALADRLVAVMAANEYPGTYRLASSSPGADYTPHISNVFSDTRADGTTVNYIIYKRTTMSSGAPSQVQSVKLYNSSGDLQEMSNTEIRDTFGPRMMTRIMAGTDGVGTYQLRSSGQGAPTATGTWVARGTATDTRNTRGDVNYSADYTRLSTRNSTQDFTANYVGNSTVNYTRLSTRNSTADFTANYTRVSQPNFTRLSTRNSTVNYTRLSTRTSQPSFTRLSTRVSNPDFTRLSTRNSTVNYTRNSTSVFTGDFTGNWTGDFVADYAGNWTGDYVGAADYTRISTRISYRGSQTFQFGTGGGELYPGWHFNGNNTWHAGRARWVGNFTGNFTGNFVGVANYTRLSTRTSQPNFTRLSTRNSVVDYTGDFTGDFVGDFTGNWTGNFVADYAGNWTGNFIADYAGNWTGDFVGDFTGNWTGDFVADYTGNFLGNYVGDFTGNWTGDFVGDFVGNWLGNYVGDFTGNWTGNYVGNYAGDTILAGTQTIDTYTLYQRTA